MTQQHKQNPCKRKHNTATKNKTCIQKHYNTYLRKYSNEVWQAADAYLGNPTKKKIETSFHFLQFHNLREANQVEIVPNNDKTCNITTQVNKAGRQQNTGRTAVPTTRFEVNILVLNIGNLFVTYILPITSIPEWQLASLVKLVYNKEKF